MAALHSGAKAACVMSRAQRESGTIPSSSRFQSHAPSVEPTTTVMAHTGVSSRSPHRPTAYRDTTIVRSAGSGASVTPSWSAHSTRWTPRTASGFSRRHRSTMTASAAPAVMPQEPSETCHVPTIAKSVRTLAPTACTQRVTMRLSCLGMPSLWQRASGYNSVLPPESTRNIVASYVS